MGDGNIILELDKQKLELPDETPRPSTGNSTPAECSTPTSPSSPPLEVEELHRNTTNSVITPGTVPGLSSSSMSEYHHGVTDGDTDTPRHYGRRNFRASADADNEFGLPLGPAAGLGPQEALAPDGNQAIFSVRGTRSFKINRHRDSVSVFPSGCMGIIDSDDEAAPPEVLVPEDTAAAPATITAPVIPTPTPSPPATPSAVLGRPNSASRNPLTGEGYGDKDYKRQTGLRKRADGNPVLGQGYDPAKNTRGTKVPPGGYSQGLW